MRLKFFCEKSIVELRWIAVLMTLPLMFSLFYHIIKSIKQLSEYDFIIEMMSSGTITHTQRLYRYF